MKEETKIIHSIPVDPQTGAISVPIYQTSTFVQEAPGVHKGYDYSRSNNPTRKAAEDLLAQLENGHSAYAFSSGLAAIDAVLKLLKSGDEIVAIDDIYGGAFRLFTHVYEKFGIKVHYVDACNPLNVLESITAQTKLIWLETPSNPTLKICDIRAIAEFKKAKQILLCVDNTFASPIIQKPLELGADLVVHSATKYLAGHSDLIGGCLVCKDEALAQKLKFIQNASGAILGPFDSWLLIRGIETLALRVQKHSENALDIAQFLCGFPEVRNVYYPGLPNHRNHAIAAHQMLHFGGVVSFDLKTDTSEAASQFLDQLHLFQLAESLGGVKSLSCLPALMTHKSIPLEKRLQAGVSNSLIRLSVGLEHVGDLKNDLNLAFQSIKQNSLADVEQ